MKQQSIKRIFHTWDKWECYLAGFYEDKHPELTKDECLQSYKEFLEDLNLFDMALIRVTLEWENSCEHYLTNEKMNRIAWLGQASACISLGIPSCFRSGYFKMSKDSQRKADELALSHLNRWLLTNGYSSVDMKGAGTKAHANIY